MFCQFSADTRQLQLFSGSCPSISGGHVSSVTYTVSQTLRCIQQLVNHRDVSLTHACLLTPTEAPQVPSGETCSNLRTENTTRAHWFKIFCTRFFWVVPQPPHTVIQYMIWGTSFETAQRSVASSHHERHVCFPCEMGIDYDPQYSGFGWRD